MAQVNPIMLISAAQIAMSKNNYEDAVKHLTNLINAFPKVTPSIALIQRCNCYYQLKEYQKCIDDGLAVLNLPDIQLQEDIVSGIKSIHGTAKHRIAESYTALNQPDKAKEYADNIEEIEKNFKDTEASNKLREEGNELYKSGNIEGALEKYKEAFELNKTSEIICGNICAAYLKIEKLDEAEYWVNKSLELKPHWQKGFYRRGLILMKKKEYYKAMEAFNECLLTAPNDAEIKKMYTEVAKSCTEFGLNENGYPKEIIKGLEELQKGSWDPVEWVKEKKSEIRYFGLEKWDRECAAHLLDTEFQQAVYDGMQTKYPDFRKGMLPRGFIPKEADRVQYDMESLPTYVLPTEMLISLYYLLILMRNVYEDMDWSIVFSMYYPPNPQNGPVRDPPLPIYDAIDSKEAKLVIDIIKYMEGENNARRNFDDMINLFNEKEFEDRKLKCIAVDEPEKFLKFVKLYNKDKKLTPQKPKSSDKNASSKVDKNLIGLIVSVLAFVCMIIYTITTSILQKKLEVNDPLTEENPTETPFTEENKDEL